MQLIRKKEAFLEPNNLFSDRWYLQITRIYISHLYNVDLAEIPNYKFKLLKKKHQQNKTECRLDNVYRNKNLYMPQQLQNCHQQKTKASQGLPVLPVSENR